MNVPIGVQWTAEDNSIGAFARAILKAKESYYNRLGKDAPEPTHIMLSKKLSDEEIATLLAETGLTEVANEDGTPHRYGLRAVWIGTYRPQEKQLDDGVWVELKSGNLHSTQWAGGDLLVRFKSNPSIVYRHKSVDRAKFIKLCHVPSAGSWYDQNLRGLPFTKETLGGQQTSPAQIEDPAPEDGPGSVILFPDEFLDEAGSEEGAFLLALERGSLMLDMELTPATTFGLPNPGTPVPARLWAQDKGGVFDFNYPEGRKAIWIRALPTSQGGALA